VDLKRTTAELNIGIHFKLANSLLLLIIFYIILNVHNENGFIFVITSMKIRVPDKKSLNEQAKQVLTAKARKTNFLRKTT